MEDPGQVSTFSIIKSEHTSTLFNYFIAELQTIGPINIYPHKTMVSIANQHKKVAYITQAGKKVIYIVFPFKQRYDDNLCFRRI